MELSEVISRCIAKADSVIEIIKEDNFGNPVKKVLNRRFNITQAAKLIGVSREAIRQAEKAGRINPPNETVASRKVYTLNEINALRDVFGTRPGRKKGDDPFVLLFMNFKGGVRKTTISTHQAQYLALKGYRVLLIDADSQASTTSIFGLTPDIDIDSNETLSLFLAGETEDLHYSIRKTYWDGIDLIPANLALYQTEFDIAHKAFSGEMNQFYARLRQGIDTVKDEYDVVIIDAPPSLGVISMNLVYAADGIIVPLPPVFHDFCSTRQFFDLLRSVVQQMKGVRNFNFIKLLISKYDGSIETETFIKYIREIFSSDLMLMNYFKDTAEIPRAAMSMMTVFEETDIRVSETHKRALKIINAVCNEIENLILSTWPSHKDAMMKDEEEALIW